MKFILCSNPSVLAFIDHPCFLGQLIPLLRVHRPFPLYNRSPGVHPFPLEIHRDFSGFLLVLLVSYFFVVVNFREKLTLNVLQVFQLVLNFVKLLVVDFEHIHVNFDFSEHPLSVIIIFVALLNYVKEGVFVPLFLLLHEGPRGYHRLAILIPINVFSVRRLFVYESNFR